MSASNDLHANDPKDTNLQQRADAATANMGTALMAGIAAAIIFTAWLIVTKWF